jgi:hypothetical protein
MKFSDFDTLALAQSHEVTVDKKKVGSGQARGYLIGIGIWNTLRGLQANLEHPLSALADGVIVTASDASSYFGLDTGTSEGQGNIASVGVFVDAGILSGSQAEDFLALAVSITHPFSNKTEQDFQIAKGTINRVPVTVERGFCKVTASEDTPAHNPQIYQRITFNNGDYEDIRVAGFTTVQNSGVYRVQCPAYLDMYVDDAYRVLS